MLAKQKWSLLSFCSPFLAFQSLIQNSVSPTCCGCSCLMWSSPSFHEAACPPVVAGSGPTSPVLDFTLPPTTCSWVSLVWAYAYWIDFLLEKKTASPAALSVTMWVSKFGNNVCEGMFVEVGGRGTCVLCCVCGGKEIAYTGVGSLLPSCGLGDEHIWALFSDYSFRMTFIFLPFHPT